MIPLGLNKEGLPIGIEIVGRIIPTLNYYTSLNCLNL